MNIILNLRSRPQLNSNNQNKLLDITTIGMQGGHKSRHSEFFEEEEMKILFQYLGIIWIKMEMNLSLWKKGKWT